MMPAEADASTDSHDRSLRAEPPQTQKTKKRRLRGACDACRIRKTKCDSAESPMNICSSCIANNVRCRHEMPRHQKLIDRHEEAIEYGMGYVFRYKANVPSYITSLQERIQKLEDYIVRAHPGEDIDRLISSPPQGSRNISSAGTQRTETAPNQYTSPALIFPSGHNLPTNASSPAQDEADGLEAEDLAEMALCEDLRKLTTTDAKDSRFFGQASSAMLAKHVTDIRKEMAAKGAPVPNSTKYRRAMYWDISPWEQPYINDPETMYIYPENDLLTSLVSLYFEKVNSIMPILHYPTFMASLSAAQHHWDPSFGMTVLLVCAHGAKYSHDPRVTVMNDSVGLSAGWSYFSQVPLHRRQLLYKSSLYDLQYYALASMYLIGTSMPYGCWNLTAIGLRYAYERGVHRRQGQSHPPTVESELLKRAFWALVCIDSYASSFVGRPCSMHESFDVEYPIDCDDEYWETGDPETAFRQPEGKPCSITAFKYFIKLCEILGFALRTLYANKKSKLLLGFIGADWEEKMVAELDSAMNKWREELPKYLHWGPEQKDSIFFHQSVNLHLSYYYIQIQIHRPYLIKRSPLTLPSLAMCNNAARVCSRILEASLARGARVLPNAVSVAYTAGMVITFNLLASRSAGQLSGPKEDVDNLQRCINYLREIEKRWYAAGKLLDSLREAGDIPENEESALYSHVPRVDESSSPPLEPMSTAGNMAGASNDFGNVSSSSGGLGTMLGIGTWDLRRLLLVEMGYLPDESTSDAGSFMFSPANQASTYTSGSYEPTTFGSWTNSSIAQPNDTYPLPSDTPNLINLEEWSRYLSSMGRL